MTKGHDKGYIWITLSTIHECTCFTTPIVESANPIHSLADSKRMREALDALYRLKEKRRE